MGETVILQALNRVILDQAAINQEVTATEMVTVHPLAHRQAVHHRITMITKWEKTRMAVPVAPNQRVRAFQTQIVHPLGPHRVALRRRIMIKMMVKILDRAVIRNLVRLNRMTLTL